MDLKLACGHTPSLAASGLMLSSHANQIMYVRSGGGGVLRFELDRGVPLEPQNPYPSLRVILAEKGTHF